MANYTKTVQTALFSLQERSSGTVLFSSEISVTNTIAASVFFRFGRCAAAALTTGCVFRVEAKGDDSAAAWFPLATIQTRIAAVESEAVSGTVNGGQAVVTVASTTNLTAGDIVFIRNTTPANSEWGRVLSVSTNTNITLEENLTNAQTGATVYDDAEIYPPIILDLSSVRKIRAAFFNNSGQTVAIEARLITCDSIG